MTATKSHDDCIMVQHRDGYYQHIGAAEPENWDTVVAMSQEIEHLGALQGWGEWTDSYRVRVDGVDLYYFAR